MGRVAVVAAVVSTGLVGTALPAPAAEPAVDWRPCEPDASVECGVVTVPLVPGDAGGEPIDIAVARAPARDQAHRIGVLFFNPGGPGGPGAAMFANGAAQLLFPELLERFDLVSFDPRGTGGSHQLSCGPVLSPGEPVFPGSPAEFDTMVENGRAMGDECLAAHGELVRHIDTVAVAHDMDAIRAALGEEQINYLGVSYGTHLGVTYAEHFPERVRAMVLDGPIDHGSGAARFTLEEAAAMEDGFDRFAAWCADDSSCALHGRDVGQVYDALVRRADTTPIPAPAAGDGVTVNGDAIRMALPVFLPTMRLLGDTWGPLAQALAAADEGDASAFAGGASMVGFPVSAYTAVSCMDFPPQFSGYSDAALRLSLARVVAPRVGAAVEGWAMSASCAGWPIEPTNSWAPVDVDGTAPILIAANTHDPATPLAGARRLAHRIAGSGLLVTETYGHTSYYNSACARTEEIGYLTMGELPEVDTCPT